MAQVVPETGREWSLKPRDAEAVRRLAQGAKISEVAAALLLNRGISSPSDATVFLDAPYSALHSPDLLPGATAAAERILQAIGDKRKICVYGDYDVDGTTGTAILLSLLHKLGAIVDFHVPLRLEEGYGLNSERVRTLAAEGCSLLITVDCGITSVREQKWPRKSG